MVKKFSEFLKIENTIISQPEVFDTDSYSPSDEEIVERGETSKLYNEIAKFVKYGIPNNILLIGPPGTGKTVILNNIRSELAKRPDFDVRHVNCSDKTPQVILSLINGGNIDGQMPENKLKNMFLNGLNNNCLIILDEVDKGLNLKSLLFFLSRPREQLQIFSHSISVILVSNDPNWDNSLDISVRSSLQLRRVSFERYSKGQLCNILKLRAKAGFKYDTNIQSTLLSLIAAEVADKYNGDCRVAIKALLYAAQNAENLRKSAIEESDVTRAFPKALDDIARSKLSRLSNRDFLVLFSIEESKEKTTDAIYKTFLDLIHQGLNVEKIKPTMFYYVLNYLDTHGLIKRKLDIEKIKDAPPRRIVRVSGNIDKKILEEELNNRMLKLSNR